MYLVSWHFVSNHKQKYHVVIKYIPRMKSEKCVGQFTLLINDKTNICLRKINQDITFTQVISFVRWKAKYTSICKDIPQFTIITNAIFSITKFPSSISLRVFLWVSSVLSDNIINTIFNNYVYFDYRTWIITDFLIINRITRRDSFCNQMRPHRNITKKTWLVRKKFIHIFD